MQVLGPHLNKNPFTASPDARRNPTFKSILYAALRAFHCYPSRKKQSESEKQNESESESESESEKQNESADPERV